MPFSEFREDLKNRVDEMLIGTQISVTMGQLRKIRVFVLGDVNRPGSYVVSSLATMSSALYRSGGISPIGSMRNIQLKRQGEVAATLDLYDLLLRGDTSSDLRLQPGDVLFVPPIGDTVGVGGEVKRPAIYEMRGDATAGIALDLAGGLSADAFPEAARLERIDSSRQRVVLSLNLANAPGRAEPVKGGDTLIVPRVLPDIRDSVVLEGHVQRPRPVEWRPGMRLTDLIPSAMELLPGADASYVMIRRENPTDRTIEVVSADLSAALANPTGPDNIALRERDTVHVFSLVFGRQRVIEPILDELKLQARFGEPYEEVSVSGYVRAPGAYPLESDMRVSDLIRAGGEMLEGAYGVEAELTRYSVIEGEFRTTQILDVDLDAVLAGDVSADIVLMPHDTLNISLVPDWESSWSVTLDGEITFPGEYQVRRGDTLTEVLARAGGLTDQAFPEGAIFLRESLREREREQIQVLARRLEADLATLSLESLDTSGAEALTTGQALLDQLRNQEPVGRLVIDIEQIMSRADGADIVRDIELRDGDRLLIPNRSQEVTVLGEIQYATSHLFQPGLVRNDYIALSGGLTRKADEKLIYVVRASGAVISSSRSRWFGRGDNMEIRPGDTIVVPLETDRIRPLTFWTNVTQIMYQGAIAVAAIQTFSN
jgi:protein involved in polysaccharide export with SLBB domain